MSRKDEADMNFDEERRLRRNGREGSDKLLELLRRHHGEDVKEMADAA
jgi:hypothetical protein